MDDKVFFWGFLIGLFFVLGVVIGVSTQSGSITKDCQTLKQFRINDAVYSCELGKK